MQGGGVVEDEVNIDLEAWSRCPGFRWAATKAGVERTRDGSCEVVLRARVSSIAVNANESWVSSRGPTQAVAVERTPGFTVEMTSSPPLRDYPFCAPWSYREIALTKNQPGRFVAFFSSRGV